MADIIDLDDWSFRNAKNAGTRPNGYWAEQWIWTGLGCRECFTNAITKSAGAKDMQSEIFCLRGRTDMKRMTSNEYNPCFNCNFYSSCSHIRENFPVCPERARYDRLAAIEDILGDEYELDELREMVQAKREGRIVLRSAGSGKKCGSCGHFHRIPGTKRGTCAIRRWERNRLGQTEPWRHSFTPSQSYGACREYVRGESSATE